MLDSFISYLEENNNESLIAKIFGVYTIKTNKFKAVDMVIMENTAQITNKQNWKMTFDLKGSTFNRYTKLHKHHMFWKNTLNTKAVLKDMNFHEIYRDKGD